MSTISKFSKRKDQPEASPKKDKLPAKKGEKGDELQDEERKGENSLTDYLQAPRKKRKNYVMMCMRETFDADLHLNIVNFVHSNFPQYAITTPKSLGEMQRQLNRAISLLIIDDEFDSMDKVLQMVQVLKTKRRKDQVPVLFFSRNTDELIKSYHKRLLQYHELDEMVPYDRLSNVQVMSRVRVGLEQKNRRKSRRYTVDIPLSLFHLQGNRMMTGRIVDLSVHGAKLVTDEENFVFRLGDQLKLHIPISEFVLPLEGDFLRLSAKVRRVFISGNDAGISFEHMSDNQFLQLTKYLTSLVNHQILRNQRLSAQAKLSARR